LYRKITGVKLKTGENMEIGVVRAPDAEYADRMVEVLGHKGQPWLLHVEKALNGDITELETLFYIGQLEGQVIANVMTVEYNRTGIFGHVYTRPEHRRKHACTLVMEQQMEDFRQRDGGLLLLGTGFESPAYWIYHSHGFRSLSGGFMRYATEDDFEAKHFAPGEADVVDVEWKHWPLMNALTSVPGVAVLRSMAFHLYGIDSFEGGFLSFITDWQEARRKRVKLLESASGAIVGCTTIQPNSLWDSRTYLLDLFVHPNFLSYYASLLNALELPEGKIQCYVDAASPGEKIDALQQAGFKREVLFKNQFNWNDEWFDVFVYSKFVA
jgi:hypothetical protein